MSQERLNEAPATASNRTKRRLEILKVAPIHEQLDAIWEILKAPKGAPTPKADKVREKIRGAKDRHPEKGNR